MIAYTTVFIYYPRKLNNHIKNAKLKERQVEKRTFWRKGKRREESIKGEKKEKKKWNVKEER